MAEYPYYDEDPRRNAKRQRRRRYEEDAWGQAEYADYADGDFAAAEDYAAGMVDEVQNRRYYNPDRHDDFAGSYEINDDGYTVPTRGPNNSWRSAHFGQSSEGLERATDLLARLNERNSIRGRARPTSPAPPGLPAATPPARQPHPQAPATHNLSLNISFIVMIVVTMAMFGCAILGLYAVFG
jgi:hypothetical protein